MEITPEQVEIAVSQFYSNPAGRPELNVWLTQIQHSTQAWKFSWELLNQSKSEEVQFYAGNTVYIKVSRCWNELAKEEYEPLKIRLLSCIVKYCKYKTVLSRLIKALGAYVLHTVEVEWKSALQDLISMFSPGNISELDPTTSLYLLFNIIMIIPDELDNCQETMGIRSSNKQGVVDILKRDSNVVLKLCHEIIQSNQVNNITKEAALRTVNNWIQQFSLPIPDSKDLLLSLIPFCNYGMCECVLDCIRTAITDPHSHSYPETVMAFITELLVLKSVLNEARNSNDENTSSLIYNLFTSIVEAHSRLLLKSSLTEVHRPAVVQIVSMLVECAATHGQYPTQENLSSIPFAIWYTIQDDILAFEKDQITELKMLFKPVYLKLVEIFIEKSLTPQEGALNAEEEEMFRCYRQDICDTYMYAHYLLQGDMLCCLENKLKEAVSRIQIDPGDWRFLESVLYCYSSVAESVAETDDFYIPRFIQSIPQIPFANNMQLVTVALTTLGAYADWLNFHQDHLQHVVPIMVAGLMSKSLIGPASQALRDLTLECPITIAPFSQPILQSCQKVLLDSSNLDNAETERIVTIFSRVLSVGLDQDQVMNYLNSTLTPFIHRINILKDKLDFCSVEERRELVSLLKLFSCLARHLNIENCSVDDDEDEEIIARQKREFLLRPQPLLLVFQNIMPIISEISEKAANQPEIVAALCKLLKNSISTLKESSASILQFFMQVLPRLYQVSLNSYVLDVVKQIIVFFGRDDSRVQMMALLLHSVVESTLSSVASDLWNHTDILQGFLLLMATTVKKVPRLLPVSHMPSVFTIGIECLRLPEECTVKAAGLFLTSFIVYSKSIPESQFQLIVSHSIQKLVRDLFYCICASPRHNLSSFSDILNVLCKLYGNELVQSFKVIQSEESFPSPRVTTQQKVEFGKKVLRNRGNKQKVLEAVTDLALISRGIAGTEYAAQTRSFI